MVIRKEHLKRTCHFFSEEESLTPRTSGDNLHCRLDSSDSPDPLLDHSDYMKIKETKKAYMYLKVSQTSIQKKKKKDVLDFRTTTISYEVWIP